VTGQFPSLMGDEFAALDPAVRAVHGGRSLVLHGRADVARGNSLAARWLCSLARLARDQRDSPVTVEIETHGAREVWTRRFGASPLMRSVLAPHRGALCERFGPAAFDFTLSAEHGAVRWRAVRARLFGIPLPASCLTAIEARIFASGGLYAFEVKVALPLLGTIIGYRGRLELPRSRSHPVP
jgi:hypothetical protein